MYRTSDRTIQISDQQELLHEGRSPVGLSVVASVEGLNNFGLSSAPEGATLHEFSPSVALVALAPAGHEGRALRGAVLGREHAHHPLGPR